MKKSILYILFALFSLSAAVSLTACKDDGVEISGANKSKTPKNVKLLEYGPTSLTICWDSSAARRRTPYSSSTGR